MHIFKQKNNKTPNNIKNKENLISNMIDNPKIKK